jgi:hypothetical protein
VTSERWGQVKSVFTEDLEQPDAGRTRILDLACGPDDALRREVERSLAQSSATLKSPGPCCRGWSRRLSHLREARAASAPPPR